MSANGENIDKVGRLTHVSRHSWDNSRPSHLSPHVMTILQGRSTGLSGELPYFEVAIRPYCILLASRSMGAPVLSGLLRRAERVFRDSAGPIERSRYRRLVRSVHTPRKLARGAGLFLSIALHMPRVEGHRVWP